ncbi:SDR family NAD(P)-dependent oxidoreductase [Micromonospora sp. SH-82]|uniref:SDR family NAD(P)-dependent oxidoreductase n=1 Tax=Micromonospora sp. SH-82 TaxID=3132938 RepID=UPI003EBAB5CC
MTDNDKVAEYLRRATLDLRAARRRLRELQSDPIAVVGMACRLPGGVHLPHHLWDLLRQGHETVSTFPTGRGWDLAGLFHPDPDHPGTSYVDRGGFLDDVAGFDAEFFGISPREATAMDPQQRLLLETSWELVESAGIDPHSLRGTPTGVFLGVARLGYGEGGTEAGDAEGYSVTGVAPAVASGRISYALGLEGPSISVDTACSSSLVALHLAVESLRLGESSLAVVGGAAVMATPGVFVDFSRQRALAADGRSKAFGAAADGFGFSEGVSLVLLERLSEAERNGHEVLAVIRGSALNQDGASNGLAAPNGTAQRKVIRQALRNCGLTPADVDAVEAHGTGTTLGDPIEANALLDTYGRDRDPEHPLWLGSVKSNIGHTQAAAGVTGLLKMVLALRHEELPATLHVDEPTPHVDWSSGAVRLATRGRPWRRGARPRRAGVSAFGISGTNAHVIVEEAPERTTERTAEGDVGPVPLVVSARSAAALRAQAAQVAELVEGSDVGLAEVGLSLAVTRARHEHRAAVVASTRAEAVRGLREVAAADLRSEDTVTGVAETSGRNVVFLFPGQGSQWVGMGAELLDSAPAFADTIRACDEAMAPLQDWSVSDVLRQEPGAPGLDRVDVVQPVLFAVMVSLARLWQSHGVTPAAVVGHSQGEIAAAHVAGALSLADAARLVVGRSRLLRSLSGGGGMSAVALGEAEVRRRLRSWEDRISVAAVNGPRSVVVAGEPEALREWGRERQAEGVRVREIDVDYASHSPQIDGVRDEILAVTGEIRPQSAEITFYSTVDVRALDGADLDAGYWYRNLRETVRFADAIARLADSGYDAFVEVSPHPVVVSAVAEAVEEAGVEDAVVVGTLSRGDGGPVAFLRSAATAHCAGVDVDWTPALPKAATIPLPTYPFQRRPYWLRPSAPAPASHDLAYRVSWTPITPPEGGVLDGDWLVVHPEGRTGWVDGLAAAITAGGGRVVTHPVDSAISRTDLAEALARRDGTFRGVLSWVATDERHVEAGAVALLTLTQALGDAGIDAPLWCLTQEAVRTPVDGDLALPAQAALHGFAQVARLELARRFGGVLDLPATVDAAGTRLVAAVLAGGGEDVVAVRGDRLYGRRLVRATLPPPGGGFTPHGTVLVTGAAGPVGGRLARWLAERGATRLVLPGAHPGEELLTEIRAAGATAVVCEPEAEALRTAIGQELPTVLVHAETLTNFARVADADPEDFAATVAAKTALPTVLAEVLGDHRLEREVYCSSVAGVWGGVGMAAYAAGSAYLDALVEHRRARGHTSASVAWTPWALPGAVDDGRLRERGLRNLDVADALGTWERLLRAGAVSVAVADVDWAVFTEGFAAIRPTPLFDELLDRRGDPDGAPVDRPGEPAGEWGRRLAALSPQEQRETLLTLVGETVAEVLGHETGTEINTRRAFSELGLDSLGSMALRQRLAARTGLRMPASLVFDHPTVTALARYLRRLVVGDSDPTPVRVFGPTDEAEPVAVVGIGCRFPGGIASPEDLWRVVADGTSITTGFPTDRGWDLRRLYHPDPDHPGTSYVDKGGFLDGAPDFDPGFFGITPREALAMDPQQRLILEIAWEAVERAGIDPETLLGSDTGVFVGMNGQSYLQLLTGEGDRLNGYQGLGNSASVLSGRVAYTFGWEGPALTVDTACSSSLVAIHLAMQSLRRGECSLALAGGVTVMADPYTFVDFSAQRGLAADGRCKAFSAQADGFALAEGVAALVLEPLSKARRNGHQVLAVLRGSAVNQDGASNGLAAPNGPSQERVIRQALTVSGLRPADIDMVEAHGTGTELGDPIEAGALIAAYGRDRDRPLWLGSVKTNIGHTQAAAGAAGVIKAVLAMRNGVLPRSLHAEELSPHIDWADGRVEVLREAQPWPPGERPRRAGVSSFGVSGTNAHVIVEEAPAEPDPEPVPATPEGPLPFVLHGRSVQTVRSQARTLAEHLRATGHRDLADTARTLATGRARFDVRAAVLGTDREGVCAALDALAQDRPSPDVVAPAVSAARTPVLVFPGQGSQWIGMARDLLDSSEVFAESMGRCAEALSPHTDWDLLDVVRGVGDPDPYDRVDVLQPVLFAVMVSLARLWQSYGVTPGAVVGHSQGEIAAAHVAGALSLADAARVVALRSRVLRELDDQGGMVSVGTSRAELDSVLRRWDGRVAVAAVNGPGTLVVAGPTAELDEFFAVAEASEMRPRRIAVRYASHSPEVARVENRLAAELGTVTAVGGTVPLYSTATGDLLDTTAMDAGYWYRNLRQPVLFEHAVRSLLERGFETFIEVSPHPVLLMAVQETAEDAERPVTGVSTLRRDHDGASEFLRNLLRAHVHGVDVDLRPAVAHGRLVDLPTYPFDRQRLWPKPHRRADASSLGVRDSAHPLLHAAVDVPGHGGAVFTGRLSPDEQQWLTQHVVGGRNLVPGSVLVDLALTAGADVGVPVLEELVLQQPLVLTAAGALLRLSVGAADEDGRRTVEIHAAEDVSDPAEARWSAYATGTLAVGVAGGGRDGTPWPPPGATALTVTDHYDTLAELGYEYGPAFQALRAAWQHGDAVYAEVSLDSAEEGYAFDPVLLDAVAQTFGLTSRTSGKLPFAWRGVTLHATGATAVRVVATPAGPDAVALRVTDPTGQLVATVDALVVRDAGAQWDRPRGSDGDLHRLEWVRLATPDPTPAAVVHVAADGLDDLLRTGGPAPQAVVVRYHPDGDDPTAEARHGVLWAATLVRRWLDDHRWPATTLVVATSAGVEVSAEDDAPRPGAAAVWGVLRCAQAESPDRFVLVDGDPETPPAVPDNPQLAVRAGAVFVPRLTPLVGPVPAVADRAYRLVPGGGSIEAVAFAPAPDADRPLAPEEVRVAVRATGVNFRDVLLALGMYPEPAEMGTEAAGVVTEVGSGVQRFTPGQTVTGLFQGAFGPVAVTDHRLLTPVPDGWRAVDAAAVPIAFTTAHYALHDLAGLRAGQSVLVHAAAGGVGMAAVALARRAGAEVFATASPAKHPTLRALGLDDDHIASSRESGFGERFAARTGGRGVDVVLNSLTGDLLDESAGLLADGGVFVEMGKTDLRPAEQFRGRYVPFDLSEAGPDRLGEILGEVVGLLAAGDLDRLPVSVWELSAAPAALTHMSRGRHVGKLVLTQPAPVHPDGTVLVTGGTGTLGRLVARHLVTAHGVPHLLVASRRGPAAPGAAELRADVERLGATIEIVACDTADREALAGLLDSIPADRPLTGVVHTAGVLADGLVTSIDETATDQVLRAKVDAAWHLHDLTRDADLSFFVLFSSAASVLAGPGQGVYAAANGVLNALAGQRRALGLPAKALGWGLWAQVSEMTSGLGDRIARTGVAALPTERALALFDAALRSGGEVLFPLSVDRSALRRAEYVPEVLRGAVRSTPRAANRAETPGRGLLDRLVGAPVADQVAALAELVRSHAAAVAGYDSADQLPERKAFKDLGFDSLAAVELRNRLGATTGVRLPSTLVFDHPTPLAVAEHLRAELFADSAPDVGVGARLDDLERALDALPDPRGHADVGARLEALLRRWQSRRPPETESVTISDDASDDELFSMLDRRLGGGGDV